MVSNTDVIESLKQVIDPEIGLNIIDIGLVYRIEVVDDDTVEVDFTLTTPGCPLVDTINDDIVDVIQRDLKVKNVITSVVWSPPWTLEFMSEEARLELGYPI